MTEQGAGGWTMAYCHQCQEPASMVGDSFIHLDGTPLCRRRSAMTEHLPECPVWRCCKPDEKATMHTCICPDDARIGGLITRQIAEKIGRRIGQYGCVIPEQQHLPECPCEPCICSYLRACEERVIAAAVQRVEALWSIDPSWDGTNWNNALHAAIAAIKEDN